MIRRWLIRTLFILPLLLCVATWPLTHFLWADTYYASPRTVWACGVGHSTLYFMLDDSVGAVTGWHVRCTLLESSPGTLLLRLTNEPSFLGFIIRPYNPSTGSSWFVGIPFWFLTLLLALPLFVVWRKTRPHNNPATAFPVVMKAKEEMP